MSVGSREELSRVEHGALLHSVVFRSEEHKKGVWEFGSLRGHM